ncbi:alpha/beta fold hydrolase [Microbacterium stercoris]|uniref:Alpha/beta hydrolase n=1 Tax=Microbacterium stercoris TaxID=2820289 RepID=A0A939TPR3_9MICO|nr:alpha/beta hydrolase [Microbacterium stercoris]MBO3662356.1 alpha/beta hydrolase [Microbacterium stercoris]MBO3664348.1 alpha/beta hydrolase [Microbacterium stercoris]
MSSARRSVVSRLRDRVIARRGPSLHVAVDEGEGPAVVLVHGIASSHATFENVVPLLRGRHRVIAVDLMGFGESPSPPDARFTLEEHVEHLERTLARLDLAEPFVLVGHSMGALIATRFAARRSSDLMGLVLVSPPVYLPPDLVGDPVDRAAMGLYRRVYDFLRRKRTFTLRNAALLARMSPIKDAFEVSERNWEAFVLSLQNAIETQTIVTDAAATDVRIEVVYGTLDPFLVPAGLRVIERMRHVTVHRIRGGDHLIRRPMARVIAMAVESFRTREERPGTDMLPGSA